MTGAVAKDTGVVDAALAGRDGDARRVVRAWRWLTGGRRVRDRDRRTLVACSGGADSSALAIALAGADERTVLAHVVHDLRPRAVTLEDRDSAAALAERLGVAFVSAEVKVADGPGNAEGRARAARYAALEQLAVQVGTPFVATGHHADDQLETLIMRLIRGAGPAGMRGVRARRDLGRVRVVRPLLGLDRAACEWVCDAIGWAWCEDETNGDGSLVRNAIRARVTPVLRELSASAPEKAARAAELFEDLNGLVRDHAAAVEARGRVGPGRWAWAREDLARERRVVIGAVVRSIATGEENAGADGLAWETVDRAVEAVIAGPDGRRTFPLGRAVIEVTGARVEVRTEDGS